MWTIEPDEEAWAVLEDAGYAFDGEPAAMFMDLAELGPPATGDLEWDAEAAPEEVGRVNDLAYGYPEGEGMSPAIGMPPPEFGVRSYRAFAAGQVASVLQTVDVGTDCLICWVATLPEHHGKRLASRLLHAALGEARERGLRTTTLQASMLGRGVYQRLGYSTIAPLQLHERRR
jgi:GNAT superfamily N-acetyltransferase